MEFLILQELCPYKHHDFHFHQMGANHQAILKLKCSSMRVVNEKDHLSSFDTEGKSLPMIYCWLLSTLMKFQYYQRQRPAVNHFLKTFIIIYDQNIGYSIPTFRGRSIYYICWNVGHMGNKVFPLVKEISLQWGAKLSLYYRKDIDRKI